MIIQPILKLFFEQGNPLCKAFDCQNMTTHRNAKRQRNCKQQHYCTQKEEIGWVNKSDSRGAIINKLRK